MNFCKMHGLGNDFILLNGMDNPIDDYTQLAQKLCHRNLGIGADGILIVLPSKIADIRMRIINSDGSEANMCGNGIRCFAKYVFEKKIIAKEKFTIETFAGIIKPELMIQNNKISAIKVDMGKPNLERAEIPMLGKKGAVISEPIKVDNETYSITSMLMGVPHSMIFVDNIDSAPVESLGPKIEKHESFPKKTNVNFVEVLNRKEISVKTWERGAGLTYACGTGSCASVVASYLTGQTDRNVTVHLKYGDLVIDFLEDNTVFMTGPAEEVFCGVTL